MMMSGVLTLEAVKSVNACVCFISRDQTSDHSDSAQVSFDGSSIQKVPVELYKVHSNCVESIQRQTIE